MSSSANRPAFRPKIQRLTLAAISIVLTLTLAACSDTSTNPSQKSSGFSDAYLFATEAWKELSDIGTYVGRERVRQSVVSRYGRGGRRANSMTFHQKVQPVVTVAEDGMSAKIRTRLFQLNSSLASPGSYI